jgi:hypothetical protein
LDDPNTFRDLTKPVGALNATRLAAFREQLEGMRGGDMKPFMYGSHYSNAGFVLYYMLRVQPFTRLAVDLQSGSFDCPDRLFFSVAQTWHGVTHNKSDVKELIPEFFTTPEIFRNDQNLPLGQLQVRCSQRAKSGARSKSRVAMGHFIDMWFMLQDGTTVGDVRLPPWAHSAEEFVWANRAALESEYVSANLHHWIDLMFGAKQQGPAAEAADNVFYFLTYENQVLLDSVSDADLKESLVSQIANYGQCPVQLFRRLHVPRMAAAACSIPVLHLPSGAPLRAFARAVEPAASHSVGSSRTLHVPLESFVADARIAAGTSGLEGAHIASVSDATSTAFPDVTDGALQVALHSLRWTAQRAIKVPVVHATAGAVAESAAAGIAAGLGVYTALCHPAAGPALMSAQLATRAALISNAVSQISSADGCAASIVAAATAALTRDRDQGPQAAAKPFILSGATTLCPRDQQLAFVACLGGRALCCVMGDASFALHRWSPLLTEAGLPFEIRQDKLRAVACSGAVAASIPSSGRSASVPFEPLLSGLFSAPSDGAATSAVLATLAGSAQAVSLGSCYALLSLPSEGTSVASLLGPGNVRSSASHSGSSSGHGDALLFSCGYVDGCLRWQLLPGASNRSGRAGGGGADVWDSRVSGAGDVTCVAAAGEGGSNGCGDGSLLLVTGHSNGQVRLWSVVRHSASNAVADAVATSWSDLGFHNRAHFPASCSNSAVPIAAGDTTDYSCVQQVYCSLQQAPVTAVSASTALGVIVAGLGNGTVAIISARDGRVHRIVPYPLRDVLSSDTAFPAFPIMSRSGEPTVKKTSLDPSVAVWDAALKAELAKPSSKDCSLLLPCVTHLVITAAGYIAVHWHRPQLLLPHEARDDPPLARAGDEEGDLHALHAASELGLLSINGRCCAHVRFIGESGAAEASGSATPASALSRVCSFNAVTTGTPLPASAGAQTASPQAKSPRDSSSSRKMRQTLATLPSITALDATRDGTVVLVGLSTGEVLTLHGLTLELCGRLCLHQETTQAAAAALRSAASAIAVATFAAGAAAANAAAAASNVSSVNGGGPSTGISAGLNAARSSFASAFGGLRGATKQLTGQVRGTMKGGEGSAETPSESSMLSAAAGGPASTNQQQSLLGTGVAGASTRLHAAAAVTALRFVDDHRTLLVGCGDGRLCLVTDLAAAQKTLATTLQQGLFSLV